MGSIDSLVLQTAHDGSTQDTHAEHAYGRNTIQGQGTTLGKLLGNETESRRPEESLTQRINGRGNQDDETGRLRKEEQADDRSASSCSNWFNHWPTFAALFWFKCAAIPLLLAVILFAKA